MGDLAASDRDRAALLERYISLREAQRRINSELLKRLAKPTLLEAGRRLGVLRRGSLMFESEEDLDVVADFCVYDLVRSGRNAVDRYRLLADVERESTAAKVLDAMAGRPPVSIFRVEWPVPGVGVELRDLIEDEVTLVVDQGLAATGQPGSCFAARLLRFPGVDVTMTSGAVLAADADFAAGLAEGTLAELGPRPHQVARRMPAEDRAQITVHILRELLRWRADMAR